MRILVLFFFALFMLPYKANACLWVAIPDSKPEEQAKAHDDIIKNAIFIGTVKLIDLQKLDTYKFVATYEIIQSYKQTEEFKDNKIIADYPDTNSCQRGHPEQGQIVEEIFFRTNGKIRISNQPEHGQGHKFWLKARAGKNPLDSMDVEKNTCLNEGNKWEIVEGWHNRIYCRVPTKDSGKECDDRSDCEAGCFADPKNIPSDVIDKLEIKNMSKSTEMIAQRSPELKNYSYSIKGLCAAWKKEKVCGYQVKNGVIENSPECLGE